MFNQSATDFVRRFRSAQTRLVLAKSQVCSLCEATAESSGIPLRVTGTTLAFDLRRLARDIMRAMKDRKAPRVSVQMLAKASAFDCAKG